MLGVGGHFYNNIFTILQQQHNIFNNELVTLRIKQVLTISNFLNY